MDPLLLVLALHIVAFAAWMTGMWYLPRLMVYHADAPVGSETSETFKVMERRLLRTILTPAMVVTLLAGITLATGEGAWSQGWLGAKLVLVLLMTGVHGLLAGHTKRFGRDERPWTARRYRILNEVPTVLFVLIVFLAVVKPF